MVVSRAAAPLSPPIDWVESAGGNSLFDLSGGSTSGSHGLGHVHRRIGRDDVFTDPLVRDRGPWSSATSCTAPRSDDLSPCAARVAYPDDLCGRGWIPR